MTVLIYFFFMFLEMFILLAVAIYGVGLLFSAFKGAPYVPTSKKQLEKILKNVRLNKSSHFIELGSGDGRLLRYAAKQYGITGVGIEINPLLIWWSAFLSKRDGTSHKVQFINKNIFDYSFNRTDYLYIFLMPELIMKLIPKFKKELKKGAIIISHGFKIVGFEQRLIYVEIDKTFSTFYYKI
ncbi:MAG: class I SAM-dependent methyltransferase [bacterium]